MRLWPYRLNSRNQSIAALISTKSTGVAKPDFFTSDNVWEKYKELKPKISEKATAFLAAISNANVKVLAELDMNPKTGEGDWPAIQKNPPEEISILKVKFQGHEEAASDGIYMVVLPHPIPVGDRMGDVASGMFVRNEDVGLIKAWNSPITGSLISPASSKLRKRAVVLGNPGISKSWHLWKYLVMAANTKVWDQFAKGEAFPNQPKVIAFVFGGEPITVDVYFLETNVVHRFDSIDVLAVLNELAKDGRVRMLYEPASSLDSVPHNNLLHYNIPCTAALSPRTVRYKEFLKQPAQLPPHIMSCHTMPELVAVVQFFAHLSGVESQDMAASLARLNKRVEVVGPFLRILLLDDASFTTYEKETRGITSALTLHQLNRALKSIETDGDEAFSKISHRIARYVTLKASDGDFFTKELRPASSLVTQRLHDELGRLTTEDLRDMVLSYETGTGNTTSNPKALETLLQRYMCSEEGLCWQYGHSKLTFEATGDKPKERSETAHGMNCQKTKTISYASPKSSNMEKDILYQPRDDSYPFVDMIWVEEDASEQDSSEDMAMADTAPSEEDEKVNRESASGEGGEDVGKNTRPIFAAQCSVSGTHAKTLHVYQKLRKELEMPQEQLLIVCMATIPKCVESYLTGPVSTYFAATTKRKANGDVSFEVPKNVEFRVLLPGKELKNEAPQEAAYKAVLNNVYTQPTRQAPTRAPAR